MAGSTCVLMAGASRSSVVSRSPHHSCFPRDVICAVRDAADETNILSSEATLEFWSLPEGVRSRQKPREYGLAAPTDVAGTCTASYFRP
jgi:hypothetical protein